MTGNYALKQRRKIEDLKANLKGRPGTYNTGDKESNDESQSRTYNTEDKGSNDELIKFCESIPKKLTENSVFENNQYKYINHLAKKGTINGIMKANKISNLTIQQLVVAFEAEMDIFKYLMSKHKNSRALAFVKLIVEPTYDLWKKSCQKEIDNAIKEGTITSDITKDYDNNYDIVTHQTAKEYLDAISKYQGRNELYRYKPDGKSFVETWYGKKHRDSCIEEEDSVEIDGNKMYNVNGILNYHIGIQRGINVLREAAKKHRHTRGNIFADEFKKIVNASQKVLDLACSNPEKLSKMEDFC
ncbi:MAG: hypothetical protein IJT14_01595 [Rickettsiales bacterium]|nr:hypothetical protein [Rickettsiales bacterium]